MKTETLKLVTIIVQDSLADALKKLVEEAGAKGYTYQTVAGKGAHGSRESTEWEGANVKIEVIVSEEISNKILEQIREQFLNKFALVVFVVDAQVIRAGYFI